MNTADENRQDFDWIVEKFAQGSLGIDYGDATNEQIDRLSEILDDHTSIRPHDGESYAQHMRHYLPRGFVYLTTSREGSVAASYHARADHTFRHGTIGIESIIALADKDDELSDEEFDSVF